jgi:catechol 2,3-dioxygenase-like lactoylglutathione lyase family enzyme
MSSANFSHCIPFLPVKNLEETISFYRDVLGFRDEWYWGTPHTDAGIGRDALNLLFVANPEFVQAINNDQHRLEICVFVSNVDELFKDFKARGVAILSELKNEPWNVREFSIIDCNGYVLRIGEGLENEPLETHSMINQNENR